MLHYERLGIPNNSDVEIIKKAYRHLARLYHPDKNKEPGADVVFREINESYVYLMNDYTIEHNIATMFGNFFGHLLRPRGPVVRTHLTITLNELNTGGTFKVNYARIVHDGEEYVFGIKMPKMVERMLETEVYVEPCYDEKIPLLVPNAAVCDGMIAGDLEVKIVVARHPCYKRMHNTLNVETEVVMSLKEALLGFVRDFELLDGTVVTVCRGDVTNPYDYVVVRGYGMRGGDLYIKPKVVFPMSIDAETVDVLNELMF
jgi:DnaJ-class molecular chaperone